MIRVPVLGESNSLLGFDGLGFSLRKSVKRIGKKVKKKFIKAAPFLSIAAQALNFIPGLGVAVGAAITAGAAALTIGAKVLQAKEAKKALKKEEQKAAEEEAAAAAAAAEAEMETAYDKGAAFFASTYGMTREKFIALPIVEKMNFLYGALYDQNTASLRKMGISREQFLAMPREQRDQVLKAMAETMAVALSKTRTMYIIGASVIGVGILATAFYFLIKK